MKNFGKKIASAAVISGSLIIPAASLASSAQATVVVTPSPHLHGTSGYHVYEHNAPNGGYASQSACQDTLNSIINAIHAVPAVFMSHGTCDYGKIAYMSGKNKLTKMGYSYVYIDYFSPKAVVAGDKKFS